MYYLEPLYSLSAEEAALMHQVTARVAKVVFAALMAIVVLALLTAAAARWLQMIEWCRLELSSLSCALYLSGI